MVDAATAIAAAPRPAPPPGDALDPVRRALLAAARDDAGRLRADAAERAARTLVDARARADALRAAAGARGAEEAAAALAVERTRAVREARAAVLKARREAYEELRARGLRAVARLREEPAYGPARDRLADAVRRVLGPDAQVSEADSGGVVGQAPGRRLDYSLAAFAAAVVDELAAELFEAGEGDAA